MTKKIFFMLAVGALLLLQFGDCMASLPLSPQSMQCCRSMPCTPANHSNRCCEKMVSSQTPDMMPVDHVSLHVPVVATIEYPQAFQVVRSTSTTAVTIRIKQHSPPELYMLHASLLI